LYNRRFFEEELLRIDTERNLPLSVLMLDVNGLKLTNDAFGHEMGDKLLKKVAEIIKKECRCDDIVARTGGDEFAVILPKTDENQAEAIKKRIMDSASGDTLDSIIISVAVGYDTKTDINQKINQILNNSENQMYKDKIKTSRVMRNQTLQMIIGTLNNKYEREQVHTERVSKFCYHIALAMKMSTEEVKTLETVGYLHDIGKIMVPFDILNKPGRLTNDEYELIKKHSEAGYQILKSVEEYSSLAEYVLCHHERWDGLGYPRNLEGEKIPLTARIIAVADAFESMTAGRPYKKAMNKNEAVLELRKNAGTQFDPEIVEVFIEKVLNCNDYNLIS
jgi:diguanylate cyclase (GGDEF)-like protein